jgi:peptidoglycan/LPS O-acetylase OafA/YrhL
MSQRLPQLDGLRGIAILGALLSHYSWALPEASPHTPFSILKRVLSFGWIGVDLFFVLSGFLIGGILIANRHRPPANYFQSFYARRFFRIIPLYAIAVALYALTGFSSKLEAFVGSGTVISGWWYVTLTQNIEGALYNDLYSFGQSWSLAIEEQFYLLVPLAIFLIPIRWLPRGLVGLIVASLVFRGTLMVFGGNIDRAVYTLLPSRMDSLLIGIGCAWILEYRSKWLRREQIIITGLLAGIGGTLLFIVMNWDQSSAQMSTIGFTMIAALAQSR